MASQLESDMTRISVVDHHLIPSLQNHAVSLHPTLGRTLEAKRHQGLELHPALIHRTEHLEQDFDLARDKGFSCKRQPLRKTMENTYVNSPESS